jgi:hypothetical protein
MSQIEPLQNLEFVLPYNAKNLYAALAYGARGTGMNGEPEIFDAQDLESIAELDIVKYLDGYLFEYCRERDFHAKTIVLEKNYIDKDFIKEYAGYFATAYQRVEKKTTRLHFFSHAFNASQLDQMLGELNPPNISEGTPTLANFMAKSYLGFVVVRPMHKNFIGRTCLKHYPRDKKSQSSGR